jgi:HEPN domain-containing protein
MNRKAFQEISKIRVREAQELLDAGHYPGAFYLIGYAVECALKACVSKQVKRYDFPDKKLATEAFTHDLEKLVRVAGLAPKFQRIRIDCESEANHDLINGSLKPTTYVSA